MTHQSISDERIVEVLNEMPTARRDQVAAVIGISATHLRVRIKAIDPKSIPPLQRIRRHSGHRAKPLAAISQSPSVPEGVLPLLREWFDRADAACMMIELKRLIFIWQGERTETRREQRQNRERGAWTPRAIAAEQKRLEGVDAPPPEDF